MNNDVDQKAALLRALADRERAGDVYGEAGDALREARDAVRQAKGNFEKASYHVGGIMNNMKIQQVFRNGMVYELNSLGSAYAMQADMYITEDGHPLSGDDPRRYTDNPPVFNGLVIDGHDLVGVAG